MTSLALPINLTLSWREATELDQPFLRQLHDLNRPEFAPLPDSVRQPLLDMQYRARTQGYMAQYPQAHTVILLDGQAAVGQMLLDEQAEHLTLVDVAVLPGKQGQGIGTAALKQVQAHAGQRCILLQVVPNTPAERLYRRLGFEVTAQNESRLQMTWTPAPPASPPEEP